jgi:ankyrin repeat protein
MSAARALPASPSLDSLRKQAKRLARDAAAGNADAVARVHAQLPRAPLPLSHRDAQLVIAREYGFAGWQDLIAEVEKRLGGALEWAVSQARTAIHDRNDERLRTLLAEYPALISWHSDSGETLLDSTTSYAIDSSDPERERTYNRPAAAEILIDAGATVQRKTWEHVIRTGAAGMLHLLARKNALPRTLPVLAALGDDAAVRARLDGSGDDARADEAASVITRALIDACRFKHAGIASFLLERLVALDPELGRRVDRWQGRQAFVEFLIQRPASASEWGLEMTPWESFVFRQLTSALAAGDLPAFHHWLQEEPSLLQPAFVTLQEATIARCCWQKHRETFITALLEHDPALLRVDPPPSSQAIVHALSYGNAHLIPVLTRIWPLPDDLPHAAGTGNAAAVARWFDAAGRPALGSLARQYPGSDPQFKADDLGWGPVTTQQVLDVALAWAVLNRHFEIAAFLLQRGADINTNWGTHEPASILHEAAIQGNEDAVSFLVDHGADLDREDYRYHSNAEGWARYGSHDERMAELLAAARRSRRNSSAR